MKILTITRDIDQAQNFTYPRRAQLLTHPEMTNPVQNILDYTNVAMYNPRTGRLIQGIPDVRQYIQSTGQQAVSLYPDVEEWLFSLYEETMPNMSVTDRKRCYRNATSGATASFNKTAWNDGYRSVVLEENMDNQEGVKLQPTIFRGWTIEVLRPPFLVGNVEKQWRVAFKLLNINRPQEFLNMRYSDPRNRIYMGPMINWYVPSRTVRGAKPSNPVGWGDPFPYGDGNDVPLVLLSNKDEGQIELSEIRWLPNDDIPNPYWGRN